MFLNPSSFLCTRVARAVMSVKKYYSSTSVLYRWLCNNWLPRYGLWPIIGVARVIYDVAIGQLVLRALFMTSHLVNWCCAH